MTTFVLGNKVPRETLLKHDTILEKRKKLGLTSPEADKQGKDMAILKENSEKEATEPIDPKE